MKGSRSTAKGVITHRLRTIALEELAWVVTIRSTQPIEGITGFGHPWLAGQICPLEVSVNKVHWNIVMLLGLGIVEMLSHYGSRVN